MRHHTLAATALLSGILLFNNISLAGDYNVRNELHDKAEYAQPPLPTRLSYLSFSIGKFDALDTQDAVDVRMEYRSGWTLLGPISPMLAVEVTSDSSVFAGAGLAIDIEPVQHAYITPSFVIGHYDKGDGRDLGSSLQFRTQFEMGYEWTGGHRLGIAASHISNAGRKDYNPGTEILSLYYHIPIESLKP